jgi:5-methylcytosine-specific restriction protein A
MRPPAHKPIGARSPQKRVYMRDGELRASHGYNNAPWRRLRLAFLHANPLCASCERKGFLVEATEVHHKLPVASNPDVMMSWEHLEALCKSCHSSITGRERAGA